MEGDDHGMLYGDMFDMIKDAYPQVVHGKESSGNEPQEPNGDAKKFYRLLEEVKQPFYPNCEKYSSLSFIVKLLHIKCISSWSNKSFSMLMELLKDAFPMCERLPSSNYEAKKIVNDLGLHYEKIDACKDDCALYYKEYLEVTQCPVCKLSRWQPNKGVKGKNKKVP